MMCCEFWTSIYNKCMFIVNGVQFGRNIRTMGCLFIRNAGNISIGDNVNINSMMRANPVGGLKTTFFTCVGAKIKIGNNVGISNSTIYARKSVIIEDSVVIGGGTKIFDTDFHSVIAEYRLNGNTNVPIIPVVLKEKSFIGAGCVILKGVTIGKGSIVGAGSIVTKSIPDNQIWAGNPARYIKDVPFI